MKRLWVILFVVPLIAVLQSCFELGSEDKEDIKNVLESDSGSVSIGQIITVVNNINQTMVITDSLAHIDYGLTYPVTYEFGIPQGSENLNVYRKYNASQDWFLIDEKTSNDFFNGIEAVRFDYDGNIAYVSVGFSILSDTIYIKPQSIEFKKQRVVFDVVVPLVFIIAGVDACKIIFTENS